MPAAGVLVDVAGRRIAADIRLDGVAAGFQRGGDESLLSYQPGLAWDVPHSKLYVAEAARDRVTVVDLAAGEVLEQMAVRSRTALGDRLRNWLFPTAEAKEMAGVVREALLSPDGSRLYLYGWRHGSPSGGEPLPIQAVATKDMAVSGQAVMPGMEVTLSPDGRYLLVAGSRPELVHRDGNVVDVRHHGSRKFVTSRAFDTEAIQVVGLLSGR